MLKNVYCAIKFFLFTNAFVYYFPAVLIFSSVINYVNGMLCKYYRFPLSSFWHTLTYNFSFVNGVIHIFYLTHRLCHERNNPSASNIVHRWNILNENSISFSLESRWIILRTKEIPELLYNSLHSFIAFLKSRTHYNHFNIHSYDYLLALWKYIIYILYRVSKILENSRKLKFRGMDSRHEDWRSSR